MRMFTRCTVSRRFLDTMADVTDTFSLMLGGIAAISLLVGGIGIMNINAGICE